MGKTSAYIKLEKFKTPVRMEFLVCLDEGDEALLLLDTLKELTIVPWNFPTPMDKNKIEPRARRVRDYEEEDEWLTQGETEDEEEEGMKQKKRKVEERELFTLQERVGSLRSHLEMKEMSEEEWEDEKRCSDLKKSWLKDFPDVFKEDLEKEDRINMEPIVIDLVDNHKDIHVFHPKTGAEVPAYMEEAARKELQRRLNAGIH